MNSNILDQQQQQQKDVDDQDKVQLRRPRRKSNDNSVNNRLNAEQNSSNGNNGRPVSIVDRLSKLQMAQSSWQARVETKDSEKFTVAGKMMRENLLSVNSNVETTPKPRSRTPSRQEKNTLKTESESNTNAAPPFASVKMTPKLRVITGGSSSANRPVSTPIKTEVEKKLVVSTPRALSLHEEEGKSVTVPKQEGIEDFFPTLSVKNEEEASTLDLDSLKPLDESVLLTVPKRATRPAAAAGGGARRRTNNPIKQLAKRTDLKESYTEVVTHVAEKEVKRMKVEKIERGTNC